MAANLTNQVRNIADVTTAVANGDLSTQDHGRGAGRDPRAQEHDQHDGRPALARSPTRSRASPARSAPKGSLGGQATSGRRRHLEGPDRQRQLAWPTTSPTRCATSPTSRPRSRRRPVEEDHRRRKGEMLELKNTINTMVDQLSSFAAEVTRVATRGRHRGQPRRPGGGRGRHRHVEGPDRQRERDGLAT